MFKTVSRLVFALIFISAGVLHFVRTDFFMRIMPPIVPWHLFWVYLSGIAEIALGVFLMIPRFSKTAARGLIALLIIVFPANIYMAIYPERFPEFGIPGLYVRLAIQFVLIGWAFWLAKAAKEIN